MTKDKEIRKNREALIRYFLSRDEEKRDIGDCAKCRALECFGFKPHDPNHKANAGYIINFAGDEFSEECKQVTELLGMTKRQWHQMESYYEGWSYLYSRSDGKPKSFKDIASWLQTLPGWPQVL